MKGSYCTQYRMNIDDNYDKTVLIEIDNGLLTNKFLNEISLKY